VAVEGFVIGAVDPVENVEESIGAEEEDIMASQIFNFPIALKNKELWNNGQRLEVDGECPQYVNWVQFALEDARQNCKYGTWGYGKLNVQERVL